MGFFILYQSWPASFYSLQREDIKKTQKNKRKNRRAKLYLNCREGFFTSIKFH